jgi:hypothetical protein
MARPPAGRGANGERPWARLARAEAVDRVPDR